MQSPRDWLSAMGRRPQWERRRGFDCSVFQQERLSPPLAFDGMGDSPHNKNRGNRMKYWETIADKLSKAGWSLGWVTAIDREGQTVWIADGFPIRPLKFVTPDNAIHTSIAR
jgi:hypothetical protein